MRTPPTSATSQASASPDGLLTLRDGARIWYTRNAARSASAAGTILYYSGGPGCADYLAPVSELLADRYASVRFEPRGCGRSSRTGPYTVSAALQDMEELRAALGIVRWTVLGHSAGADMALAYALAWPARCEQLLCVAGGRIHNDRDWRRVYEINRDGIGELLPPAASPYNMHANSMFTQSWREYCKAPDLLRRIAALNTPVHYILAGEDIRPNWPLEQLAALTPRGTCQTIAGAGHNIWLTHPDALATAMLDCLDAQPAPNIEPVSFSGTPG